MLPARMRRASYHGLRRVRGPEAIPVLYSLFHSLLEIRRQFLIYNPRYCFISTRKPSPVLNVRGAITGWVGEHGADDGEGADPEQAPKKKDMAAEDMAAEAKASGRVAEEEADEGGEHVRVAGEVGQV